MLEALIAGVRDPDALADLAKRRLRSKIGGDGSADRQVHRAPRVLDPGTRLHLDQAEKRAIHQLEAMGYHVTLDHAG